MSQKQEEKNFIEELKDIVCQDPIYREARKRKICLKNGFQHSGRFEDNKRRIAPIPYTRVRSYMLECLIDADLTLVQLKMMLYFIRKITGFENYYYYKFKTDEVCKRLGFERRNLYRYLKQLKDKNLIWIFKYENNRRIYINNYPTTWNVPNQDKLWEHAVKATGVLQDDETEQINLQPNNSTIGNNNAYASEDDSDENADGDEELYAELKKL